MLSNIKLLISYLPVIFQTLASLSTVNIIPLKLLFFIFRTNLLMPQVLRKARLCLLDLSAAFDTIDDSILITRLSSWFGFHESVFNWFKSYLSFRSFRVKCHSSFSSSRISSCGVPQGSVLGPLLFIMHITPLSTLISSLSLNHHLYADDTQLFLSFYPFNLHSSITHLQNAL